MEYAMDYGVSVLIAFIAFAIFDHIGRVASRAADGFENHK